MRSPEESAPEEENYAEAPAPKPFVPDLASLITTDEKRAWIEYANGFELEVRYVSRSTMTQLTRSATVMRFDDKQKRRLPDLDTAKLAADFAKKAVIGWRGLTVELAGLIAPLKIDHLTPEQKKTQVPFSHAQLAALAQNSFDFDQFVQNAALDLKTFAPQHEDEVGNS